MQEIEIIRKQFDEEIGAAKTTADIERIQVKYLGKKGPIQQLMKSLKDLKAEERPEAGKVINSLKEDFTERCEAFYQKHLIVEEDKQILEEKIDISLPGRRKFSGRKHIVSAVMDKALDILMNMGFSVQYGPDIETEYYNFEALNIPEYHPARDMQDTFYVEDGTLLRTHTSNVQVRVMESSKPPIRIVAPGKCFRNEDVTARSHVFFHQIEGVYIDEGVSFADLMSTMDEFLRALFEGGVEVKYRPSYFPFVEPGLEVDISCLGCAGKGCHVCKHTGWLEIAGAGMIHPEVLKNGGIDPDKYTGYAFGMGLERLIMARHRIGDIRLFTQNDIRFLEQFANI